MVLVAQAPARRLDMNCREDGQGVLCKGGIALSIERNANPSAVTSRVKDPDQLALSLEVAGFSVRRSLARTNNLKRETLRFSWPDSRHVEARL